MGEDVAEEDFARSVLLAGARGHLQRAQATLRASAPAGGGDASYANHLLRKWGFGLLAAEECHVEARLAYAAGARGG